ncbi:MAG: hypothetical protein GQ578_06825 [Desulfuromonadaceae bacterium]|nr:hypothetical protein [Desulfuromonadaceae bacterium]
MGPSGLRQAARKLGRWGAAENIPGKIFRGQKYSGDTILVNLITIINRHVPATIDGFLVPGFRMSPDFGALTDTHETLGREINPVVMSREEFGQKYAEKDRFVCRVMNEPKIFVRGGCQ